MKPQKLIYLFRISAPGKESLLTLALAPVSERLNPFLPAGSPVLRQMARNRIALNPAAEGESRTPLYYALATRPDGSDITLSEILRFLRNQGIRPVRSDRSGSSFRCRPGDITRAIETLKEKTTVPSAAMSTKKNKIMRPGKGHPAADALDWDEAINLINSLKDDGRFRDALLVGCGCYLGLRISDLLSLTWGNLLQSDELVLKEKKTGKKRTLRINPALKELAQQCRDEMNPDCPDEELCFRSWAKEDARPISRQRAAQILFEMKSRYGIRSAKVFATHSLRKTFGRRVWLQECRKGRGEEGLLLLCYAFGHSSVEITKRYLGIRQEEILSVYDSLTV